MAQIPSKKMAKPTFASVAASGYSPTTTSEPKPTLPSHPSDIMTSTQDKSLSSQPTSSTSSKIANQDAHIMTDEYKISPPQFYNDDGYTQISSDGSGKLQSFDKQSIASGTTFAMDEKESLRPDDSASMRAVAEENDELTSIHGSMIASSRRGSDIGAKAFLEQLNEISAVNSFDIHDDQANHFHPPVVAGSHHPNPQILVAPTAITEDQLSSSITPPDEKLMEALQSPRDRVFVLKLEQDIIDFIEQSKETTLSLPKCNGFYRMLTHKLADYYRLDHAVHHEQDGAAVMITRTTTCRLAPPLSGVPNSSTVSTPPLSQQARKIMRRPEDPRNSETSTAANSEGPSTNTSELGIETQVSNLSLNNGNDSKPKNLTREERKAKYNEARERIFGKGDIPIESDDVSETIDTPEDSREGSTNGKKKVTSKQRSISNDDFEPRSHYYGSNPMPSVYSNTPYLYQNYQPQANQYQMAQQGMIYPGANVTTDGPNTYLWHNQQMSPPPPPPPLPPPPQSAGNIMPQYNNVNGNYNLTNQFGNSGNYYPLQMQNNNTSTPGVASQIPYGQPTLNQWAQQPSYGPNYQYQRSSGYSNGGMSNQPYIYGPGNSWLPAQQQTPQMAMNTIHNVRPHFNPQIQSFVPGISSPRSGPMPMIPLYSSQQGVQQTSQSSVRNSSTSIDQRGAYGTHKVVSSTTPVQHNATLNLENGTATPPIIDSDVKPMPEITAKWGTPAHLPPKPPKPESMEPHKFIEINKGIPQYHGLPRLPSNGYNNNNVLNNSNGRYGN